MTVSGEQESAGFSICKMSPVQAAMAIAWLSRDVAERGPHFPGTHSWKGILQPQALVASALGPGTTRTALEGEAALGGG